MQIDTDSLGGSFDSASAETLWSARTRPITAALNTLRGSAVQARTTPPAKYQQHTRASDSSKQHNAMVSSRSTSKVTVPAVGVGRVLRDVTQLLATDVSDRRVKTRLPCDHSTAHTPALILGKTCAANGAPRAAGSRAEAVGIVASGVI